MKKKLTQAEEFDIMKLVLDKFLWIGTIIIAVGLWQIFSKAIPGAFFDGFSLLLIGIVILVLFLIILIREYEIIA